MSKESDAAQRRVLETLDALNEQRKHVRQLKATGLDSEEAEERLVELEMQQTENLAQWKSARRDAR